MTTDWTPILAISIPGDPRPAPRYQRTKGGREYMPKAYMQLKAELAWHLRAGRGPWQPQKGQLFALKVLAYRATRRRADTDNLVKTVMDAGIGVIWHDDADIERHSIARLLDRVNPRTEIRIWVKAAQGALL